MLVLFKFSGSNERYWIALAISVAFATMLGVEFGMFSTIVVLGIFKIFKDLCQAGNQS
jgi:hypothetical protein